MDQYKLIGLIIILNIALAFTSIAVNPDLTFSDWQTRSTYESTQGLITEKGTELYDPDTGMAQQSEEQIDQGTGGVSIVTIVRGIYHLFSMLATGLLTAYGSLAAYALSGTGLISAISWILGLFIILLYSMLLVKLYNNLKNKDSV